MSTNPKSISFNLKGVTNGIIAKIEKSGKSEETHFPSTLKFLKDSEEFKTFEEEVKNEITGSYAFSIHVEPDKEVHQMTLGQENYALLRKILDNTGDPDSQKKAFAEELRIAVTEDNCYTAEILKRVKFMELKAKYSLDTRFISEIIGINKQTYYQSEWKISKGEQNFSSKSTRKYFTILAKYYEFLGSSKNKLNERIEELEVGLKELIEELSTAVNKNCMVSTSGASQVLAKMKKLSGI